MKYALIRSEEAAHVPLFVKYVFVNLPFYVKRLSFFVTETCCGSYIRSKVYSEQTNP